MSSTSEEYGIVQTAYEKMKDIEQDSCPTDIDTEDLSFFSPINIDQESPDRIIISGIALAEGKWRDVYYPYEEIKKSIQKLNSTQFIVDHGIHLFWKKKKVGKIFKVEASDVLRAALYKGEITDSRMAQELNEGKWRGNSVRVLFDIIPDAKYGLRAVNLSYDDISITNSPACKSCIIIQKELKEKLHELSSEGGNQSQKYEFDSDSTQGTDTISWTFVPASEMYPPQSEKLAEWTTSYINSLPDSSFAVIEGDYKSGRCKNKSARHLPYKDKNGSIDLSHLRNALARANQIKSVCGPESASTLRSKAQKKLESAAKRAKIGEHSEKAEARELAEKELINKIGDIMKGEGTSEEKLQAVSSAVGNHELNEMDTPTMFKAVMGKIDGLQNQITELKGEELHDEDCPDCDKDKEKLSEEGGGEPDKPPKEEPKVTEEPKTETPKTETPKEETPKVETPKEKEEPKVEETPKVVETPKPVEPKPVEPKPVETPKITEEVRTPAPKPAPAPPTQPPAPVVEEKSIDLEDYTAAALMIEAYRPKIKPDERNIRFKEDEK